MFGSSGSVLKSLQYLDTEASDLFIAFIAVLQLDTGATNEMRIHVAVEVVRSHGRLAVLDSLLLPCAETA